MPFTFKLSQRLARIRRQGSVAPALAPAIVSVCAPQSITLFPPTSHHAPCRAASRDATGADPK